MKIYLFIWFAQWKIAVTSDFWRRKKPSEMLKHLPIVLENYHAKPLESEYHASINGIERPFEKDELCLKPMSHHSIMASKTDLLQVAILWGCSFPLLLTTLSVPAKHCTLVGSPCKSHRQCTIASDSLPLSPPSRRFFGAQEAIGIKVHLNILAGENCLATPVPTPGGGQVGLLRSLLGIIPEWKTNIIWKPQVAIYIYIHTAIYKYIRISIYTVNWS